MKKMRMIAIFLAVCVMMAMPMMAFAEDEASISDAKLESALRDLLEKDDSDTLLPSELATLTGEIDLSDLGITNIKGIEYLTGATSIDLSGNSIETMSSHMDELVNLESLDLSESGDRYDFPSAVLDIPNLKNLSLAASKIRQLPSSLSEMTSLETLDLSANRFDEFPTVLLDMQLVNLNIDYNFLDLSEGSTDRNRVDAMSENVSGEYLAFRQFGRLQNLTFYTSGSKIVVEWDGIDDITFYDGTVASVQGYTVLVSGDFIENTSASKRSIQIDAVAGTQYQVSVSPIYKLSQYEDFKIQSYTKVVAQLGVTGPTLIENPDPVLYENAYPTPSPTPTPTPTPAATPTPSATPAEIVMASDSPSAQPQGNTSGLNGFLGTSALMTIVLLVVILVLIIVVVVLLVVILKNKNIKGKE